MKILLLQSSVYFPSFGGGNKANRLLLEALAERGHSCSTISKSIDAQQVIDNTDEAELLSQRGIQYCTKEPHITQYQYHGVCVFAVNTLQKPDYVEFIRREYFHQQPDLLWVSDDKNGDLLKLAVALAADKTLLIVHTNMHLPVGPEATEINQTKLGYYHQCKAVLCATRYSQLYLQREAHLASHYLPFPVFGSGTFQKVARFNHGYIGIINPCALKGIDIFIALAEHFPEYEFLAVPTWGADAKDMQRLTIYNNIRIMSPHDDIAEIMQHLHILLVPSLIHETFGYVAVEAMLRGIPVLASDLGGLRDAKLGVDYLLPVRAAHTSNGSHTIPPQDITSWAQALSTLCENADIYQRISEASFQAAQDYVSNISVREFEHYFQRIITDDKSK